MKYLFVAAIALVVMLGLPQASQAGGIVKFYEGDYIALIQGGIKTRVQLACIDAPELKQTNGEESRQALKALMRDKQIQFNVLSKDRLGRLVAEVYADGMNVNKALVEQGQAHFDDGYRTGCEGYAEAEQKAQTQHLGIWQNGIEQVMLPSQFRHQEYTLSN